MEGDEFEEGEVCYYSDDDRNMDPDIDLSYIDERIQDVLGCYQKDFEGGLSADNLGARFGGYGSFLPTYRRSPSILSHPRNPQKVQSHLVPSSHILPPKGDRQNSTVLSTEALSVRDGPASSYCVPALPSSRISSVDSLVKFWASGEHVPKHEPVNLPINQSDEKTPKVRIKVGPESLLAQKTAAICSGIGLDMSPFSSPDSPTECEGDFRESQEAQGESPSCIIKIMTSFPVPDGVLLSPLDDSLVHFMEDDSLLERRRSEPIQESSAVLVNESASIRRRREIFGEMKSRDKNGRLEELKNENSKDPAANAINARSKKELDIETLTGKEIVFNALKLLLTSNKKGKIGDVAEGTGKASEASMGAKDRIVSYDSGKEALESISSQEASRKDERNSRTSLAEKVQKDKNVGRDVRKDGGEKGDKSYDLFKEDYETPKGTKDFNGGAIDPSRQKFDEKATSHLQDWMKIPHGKEQPYGARKKSKGSQSNISSASEFPKESLRVGSSAAPKDNNTHGSYFSSKSKGVDMKSHTDLWKTKVSGSDFIGNTKIGKKNGIDLLGTPCKDRAKDSNLEVPDTETRGFSHKSKERSGGREADYPSKSESHLKGDMTSPLTGNGPISDALPAEVAPIVIQENWVCCDKCQKWRLLPYGTNPNLLPKNWLCSMLNWLPGMNRCSFSEEETTNALNALYLVPAPEIQNNQQRNPDGAASVVTSVDAQHLDQNHQDLTINAVSRDGKKKHGSNAVSNATRQSDSMNLLNYTEKNQEDSVKGRNLKNMNQSSLEFNLEKRSGDKSKRQADQDGLRVSKKAKTERMHYTDEDESPVGLSTKETEIDFQKCIEYSSWDSKGVAKDVSGVSVTKPKNQVQKTMAMEEDDKRAVSGKKRQLKDWKDSQIYSETLPHNEHHVRDNWIAVKEQTSGTELRKDKKARESEIQGKESSTSMGNGRGNVTRILLSSSRDNPVDGNRLYEGGKSTSKDLPLGQHHGNNLSQWSVDGKSSSRRDSATSSSSKISWTCKIKSNLQEVKGSPVGLVSSSALRISNPDNLRRNLLGKDDATKTGLFHMNSPRRCSEGEGDAGRDNSETLRKDKAFSVVHHRSMESSLIDCGKAKDHFHEKERVNKNNYCSNRSLPPKSGNGSSSRAMKKHSPSKSGSNRGRIKISYSYNEHEDLYPMKSLKYEVENESHDSAPYKEKMMDGKSKIHGYYGVKSDKVKKSSIGKFSDGKHRGDSGRRENQSKFEGHKDSHGKLDTFCRKDWKSTARQNLLRNSDRTDRVEVASGRGKSQNFTSIGDKQETVSRWSRSVPESEKGDGSDVFPVDVYDGGDAEKAPKQLGKADGQNELHHVSLRHPARNGYGAWDKGPSPVKEDTSSLAADNALKEAENLKHSANHLKISGSGLESTELFFQAALKFLHGASLLEPCNSESAKYGEMTSLEVYSSTAKLCKYCAHEYERCKDMASAALAYKCMEVAYMRVIYTNDLIASRDRDELQMDLQMVPPVDSPSSSASDVDNLNNQAIVDKMDIVKDVSSPQVSGNHIIADGNGPKFVRLLNFAQDVKFAMAASRKSQNAFAAANVILAEAGNGEVISSVKRVLDFSFHDVEGLLRLVHLAMVALSS